MNGGGVWGVVFWGEKKMPGLRSPAASLRAFVPSFFGLLFRICRQIILIYFRRFIVCVNMFC
ncbi:MAG: hypothetical protein D6714_18110 [Bacteroidetes bacterium]|nr:MAG: hypothetical protein D6714_18110 [Bacteroidota bacterium]